MQDYIDSIARGETQIESQRSTQNCCEYVNNRGKTKHVFQLFCECNEVDESLEQIMTTGRIPNRTMCLRLEQDISDRIRFPWYGGALKLSIWFFLVPILFTLEYVIACLTLSPIIVSLLFNVWILWLSVRAMKTADSARSNMHVFYTGYALFQVGLLYYQRFAGGVSNTINYFVVLPLATTIVASYFCLRNVDPGTIVSMAPPEQNDKAALAKYYVLHSADRAKYCRIADVGVAHYDHFCIWVGRPIGRDNKRWFLLFCWSVFTGGVLFWWLTWWLTQQEQHLASGERIYMLVVATRALLGCIATCLLLSRQCWLITIGLTTYENAHLYDLQQCGWVRTKSSFWENWRSLFVGTTHVNVTQRRAL